MDLNIDWKLLAKQKDALLEVINRQEPGVLRDQMDGLLGLIDHLQDKYEPKTYRVTRTTYETFHVTAFNEAQAREEYDNTYVIGRTIDIEVEEIANVPVR